MMKKFKKESLLLSTFYIGNIIVNQSCTIESNGAFAKNKHYTDDSRITYKEECDKAENYLKNDHKSCGNMGYYLDAIDTLRHGGHIDLQGKCLSFLNDVPEKNFKVDVKILNRYLRIKSKLLFRTGKKNEAIDCLGDFCKTTNADSYSKIIFSGHVIARGDGIKSKDYQKAIEYLKIMIESQDVLWIRSKAYILLGNARDGDNYGVNHYNKALTILGSNGNVKLQAQALIGLGNAYCGKRENINGLVSYYRAWKLSVGNMEIWNIVMRKKQFIIDAIRQKLPNLSSEEKEAVKEFFPELNIANSQCDGRWNGVSSRGKYYTHNRNYRPHDRSSESREKRRDRNDEIRNRDESYIPEIRILSPPSSSYRPHDRSSENREEHKDRNDEIRIWDEGYIPNITISSRSSRNYRPHDRSSESKEERKDRKDERYYRGSRDEKYDINNSKYRKSNRSRSRDKNYKTNSGH